MALAAIKHSCVCVWPICQSLRVTLAPMSTLKLGFHGMLMLRGTPELLTMFPTDEAELTPVMSKAHLFNLFFS